MAPAIEPAAAPDSQSVSHGKRTRHSECLSDDPASDRPRRVAVAAAPPWDEPSRERDHLRWSRRAAVRPRRRAQPVARGSHEEQQSPRATTRSASSSLIFSARETEISLGRGARFPRSPFRRRRTFRALPRRDRPAPAPVPDRTARREPCHGGVAGGQPLLLIRWSAGSGGPLATADQLGDCLSEAFERQ